MSASTATVTPLEEKAVVLEKGGASPNANYAFKFVSAAIASECSYIPWISVSGQRGSRYGCVGRKQSFGYVSDQVIPEITGYK